jgi:hypothetical protein
VLIARYLKSQTIVPDTRRRRTGRFAHSPEERALIEFLDRHFPERRKRRRLEGDEGTAAHRGKGRGAARSGASAA